MDASMCEKQCFARGEVVDDERGVTLAAMVLHAQNNHHITALSSPRTIKYFSFPFLLTLTH
jgi:hypothetical protein